MNIRILMFSHLGTHLMKSTYSYVLFSLFIVSLSACTHPSETAQTPDLVPFTAETKTETDVEKLLEPDPAPEQPATIMAKQLGLFEPESKTADYVNDSFLDTKTDFEQLDESKTPLGGEYEFSTNLTSDSK